MLGLGSDLGLRWGTGLVLGSASTSASYTFDIRICTSALYPWQCRCVLYMDRYLGSLARAKLLFVLRLESNFRLWWFWWVIAGLVQKRISRECENGLTLTLTLKTILATCGSGLDPVIAFFFLPWRTLSDSCPFLDPCQGILVQHWLLLPLSLPATTVVGFEFRLPYSQRHLFNAIPDTNHNANPTNPTNPTNPNTRYCCGYDNLNSNPTTVSLRPAGPPRPSLVNVTEIKEKIKHAFSGAPLNSYRLSFSVSS